MDLIDVYVVIRREYGDMAEKSTVEKVFKYRYDAESYAKEHQPVYRHSFSEPPQDHEVRYVVEKHKLEIVLPF